MLNWSIRRCRCRGKFRVQTLAASNARMGLTIGPLPSRKADADALYARVSHAIPAIEWPFYAADIDAIMTLKRSRNAVVLAHNYQTPEIFHCVSDIVGDSLALAREAMNVDADVIVLAGVHFMAETAKLLNPEKTVLIPDPGAGCSLADSITPEDVRLLRQRYPGVPVVTYVNTSAAVKAESDICCTSGNAKAVVESLGVPRVIMLPDEFLAHNIAAADGGRRSSPGPAIAKCMSASPPRKFASCARIIPAWSCWRIPNARPRSCAEADFSGSTAAMQAYVGAPSPAAPGAAHRMFDERQCRRAISRARIRPPLQSLPAYEEDHARQYPARAGDDAA